MKEFRNIRDANMPDDKHYQDFTISHYIELLELAKKNYSFASYSKIPWGTKFILWRHDVDHSLNRALKLAKIENELGIISTYFINPRSDFYNPAEKEQYKIVKDILDLGHEIGIHFDSELVDMFDIKDENLLNKFLEGESKYIEWLFGVKPIAFSFHRPTEFVLKNFRSESYGGLINCYSKRIMEEVAYVSDSNGYWRFLRLYDVLLKAEEPSLQVLTHPEWWQDYPMPPRQRILRCIYGRAENVIKNYDQFLERHGRENFLKPDHVLRNIKKYFPDKFYFYDYLWNKKNFETLFIELWRLHRKYIMSIISSSDRESKQTDDDLYLMEKSFVILSLDELISKEDYIKLIDIKERIMKCNSLIKEEDLVLACSLLIEIICKIKSQEED